VVRTIRQECDREVALACEIRPSGAYDLDLVLLDDARLVHLAIAELPSLTAESAG
jgi:hypothetical protein